MIQATYVLTINDVMEAGKAALKRELAITRVRAEWIAMAIGLIAIVLTQKLSPLYWLILLALLFIWHAISYPGQGLKIHFQRSVTNQQIVAQITESSVTTMSETSRTETTWKGLSFTTETPNTITLVTITGTMYVFPKRAFGEQACNELRKLITQNGIPSKSR
jgi:hypothetical protein